MRRDKVMRRGGVRVMWRRRVRVMRRGGVRVMWRRRG